MPEKVFQDGVPGDFIETGMWRGGSAIFMKTVLKAYGDTSRVVADSFEGLPKSNADLYPADARDELRPAWLIVVSA